MGATISENFALKSFGTDRNGEGLYSLIVKNQHVDPDKVVCLGCSLTTSLLRELADLIKSELTEDASA